jgi:hypothetical protein
MQPQAKITVAIPGSWTISPRQQAKATDLWGIVLRILEIHGERLEKCLCATEQSLACPPDRTMPIPGGNAAATTDQLLRHLVIPSSENFSISSRFS